MLRLLRRVRGRRGSSRVRRPRGPRRPSWSRGRRSFRRSSLLRGSASPGPLCPRGSAMWSDVPFLVLQTVFVVGAQLGDPFLFGNLGGCHIPEHFGTREVDERDG